MRTYRWLLLLGIVAWLVGQSMSGFDPVEGEPGAVVVWVGQLLMVVGAAGLFMVFVMRQVVRRRLRPPGERDDES